MQKSFWLLIFMSSVACVAFGCAAMTGVPQGSELIGVYQGTFNGIYNNGSIEVKLYRSPDGSRPVYGNFGVTGSYVNFEGEMNADELQGQILLPSEGSLAGKLSPDGGSLSGTYKFTVPPFDQGTWQAQKQ